MRFTLIFIKKNYAWIWTAVDRAGKKFLDFEIGNRGFKTGNKLWQRLKKSQPIRVMTDFWKPYNRMIPDKILTQSKAETYTVEGYNSIIRHFLARFVRRTKCYSKSSEMIEISLILLINKWNNKQINN